MSISKASGTGYTNLFKPRNNPAEFTAIFRERADRQYESPLLFSTVVDLLSRVISKAQRSLDAAYQTRCKELSVSLAS